MSDEVPQPTPREHGAGDEAEPPRVSLDKGSGDGEASGRATEAEPDDGRPGAAQSVSADPWASPAGGQGAGDTVLSGAPGTPAQPPHPSVHDQQTVASLPTPDAPADAVPPAWARPADPYAPAASAPPAEAPANPFAPPSAVPPGAAPTNSYAPPANPFAPPANPFAPPAAGSPAPPYAPPAASGNPYGPSMASPLQPQETAPVPPPPMSPDGPGQVPYGYPAQQPQPGYGGPGIPSYPAAGGYGWPGLQPQPNNGMGTASLVLGILATVGFCAWPLALVMGVVAVILGALGRGKARRGEATNPGVALAGIICGAASIVLVLGFFAFFIAVYKS
ncbi:DUF4190 domain-containing protein [Streptomyces sp. NPDC059468]|uniref:DUF4190 domain-containing protein n=1 Tax=Streptomyces sp. NPDC059468 TaxID=3346845 RepID=UPI0036B23A56